jgi:hypothetical protein
VRCRTSSAPFHVDLLLQDSLGGLPLGGDDEEEEEEMDDSADVQFNVTVTKVIRLCLYCCQAAAASHKGSVFVFQDMTCGMSVWVCVTG